MSSPEVRRFAPGWTMTGVVALLLPVLVGLGLWQLERAAEKRGYEAQYLDRLGLAPGEPPRSLPGSDFLPVRLDGRYLAGEDYLVDNQVHHGQPGYWVVSRFLATDGRVFLINRGWTAAPASRERLPELSAPPGRVRLLGVLWPDTGLPPLLAPDPWPAGWPKRVQRLDVARMAAADERVVPVQVRLEAGQPGALEAVPVNADFHSERHQGYAVQWFGLALTLVIGYILFGLKRT